MYMYFYTYFLLRLAVNSHGEMQKYVLEFALLCFSSVNTFLMISM